MEICSLPGKVWAQTGENPEGPGKDRLFVGACYQPVDRSPKEIHADIAIMKKAGFNVVRMGDLSWDSFEPSEGKFDFAWFDAVMDEMRANGIRVILDIPGLPAPVWLHRKYPGVNVAAQNGATLNPAERYMDDISDPDYRRLAVRLADALTKRYAKHPALMAVGYDNEIGNSYMSYSPGAKGRFVAWLKKKYGSVSRLNEAWATQRWSRRLSGFDEVELPYVDGPGPPERHLDLRRFWSDQTIAALEDLEAVRRKNIPRVPAISNLWDTAWRKGFDYLGSYKKFVGYGAEGFYPGEPVGASFGALMTKGDLLTPIWFNEFTAGGGGYFGTKGRSRMWAYLGLIDGVQGLLAWTFNSHRGGEEQALFGLVNHDGSPSWKVDEFKRIAAEFSTLEKYGFPRPVNPEAAVAYSFESRMASSPNGPSNTVRDYFKPSYDQQVQNAFEPFFTDNIDAAIVHPAHAELSRYKLLVVAGDYLMDEASAGAIRDYVKGGGTAVMTAFSAKVDETNQWFDTPLPGRLSDVFGLRTNEFYNWGNSPLELDFNGRRLKTSVNFYEVLEPEGAEVIARFANTPDKSPAITIHKFGKGQAIYLAAPAQASVLAPLFRDLYGKLGIQRGPETPAGVYARVVEGRTLYVNTTGETKKITLSRKKKGLISGQVFEGVMRLGPGEADLLQ
jgi:beta-galactosidase